MNIAPEGIPIPFSGIPNDETPESTEACNISEAYNPVSTKGLLAAVKVDEKVELSPDGQSVTANDSKLYIFYVHYHRVLVLYDKPLMNF